MDPEELAKLTDEDLAAEMKRVGDGVEDATAVLKEAVNRIPAGGRITIPPGIYRGLPGRRWRSGIKGW